MTVNTAINKINNWIDEDNLKAASKEFWQSKEGRRHQTFRRALNVVLEVAKTSLNHNVKGTRA